MGKDETLDGCGAETQTPGKVEAKEGLNGGRDLGREFDAVGTGAGHNVYSEIGCGVHESQRVFIRARLP